MASSKSKRGQFYTVNSEYILQNLYDEDLIKRAKSVIEPFAGKGDLIKWVKSKKEDIKIEAYDIEPKAETIIQRDTLQNPPSYQRKFVITNPPYLARNKTEDKALFDKYNTNDLYKCLKGKHLTEDEQLNLAEKFNSLLKEKRNEYWSLFLPQYRESKEYARKRIPFELAYSIILYIIND